MLCKDHFLSCSKLGDSGGFELVKFRSKNELDTFVPRNCTILELLSALLQYQNMNEYMNDHRMKNLKIPL